MTRSSTVALFAALVLFTPAFAQADKEIVKVNGTSIRQSEVMEKLWQRYGVETLDEMVDELLLRQEALKRNIKADQGEVAAHSSSHTLAIAAREMACGARACEARTRSQAGDLWRRRQRGRARAARYGRARNSRSTTSIAATMAAHDSTKIV